MVDSINQYIRYHSEPCSGFVSIKEWNEHFGTNLEENEELEYKIMKLRSELGHNEFIPTSILKIARKLKEKAKKGVAGAIEDKTAVYKSNYVTKRWKKALGGAFHVGYAARKWKKYKANREAKKQDQLDEPADVGQEDAQEEKQQEEEQVEDLDDLLQAEPEYEEVAETDKEKKARMDRIKQRVEQRNVMTKQREVVTKLQDIKKSSERAKDVKSGKVAADKLMKLKKARDKEKIKAKLNKRKQQMKSKYHDEYEEGDDDGADDGGFQQAVDELEISDAQALNHLVAFKGKFDDIRTRVMKGKARYIEKLQAYVDGDDTAEIRMYNGTKMRIANLKPDRESLSKALQAFPSGPHFIECD